MRKFYQMMVLISLLICITVMGCGEKKSAGVVFCEEKVTEVYINPPTELHDSGAMPDDVFEKAMVNGECAVKSCAHYEGGASDEEITKWFSSNAIRKHCS